jgi:hypothetical protein
VNLDTLIGPRPLLADARRLRQIRRLLVRNQPLPGARDEADGTGPTEVATLDDVRTMRTQLDLRTREGLRVTASGGNLARPVPGQLNVKDFCLPGRGQVGPRPVRPQARL